MAVTQSLSRPYADVHQQTKGPGDARPTALQVIEDCGVLGKLADKTIVITGPSAGLGIETARALYEAGARFILSARDVAKMDKIIDDFVSNAKYNKTGPKPETFEMDLNSLESVRKGAEAIKAKPGGKLNILLENAGIMAVPYGKTVDGLESHMGVNHFAHFLLFQLLKPLLLETA